MAKAVTLSMIAEKVGVSKSTISDVLHNRKGKIKVSDQTRERIMQAVKSLNYEPNAFASALVTGKTYNIGFLLSSKTTLGLANPYFATLMSGVQSTCKQRGYNCMVSAYDLSSVSDFVVPTKLKRRSVDGIVIAGYVEDEVVQTFIDYDIPFVLVGESTDFLRMGILSVARDMVSDWKMIFEHLYQLGHKHIGVGGLFSQHSLELFDEAVGGFRSMHSADQIGFKGYNDLDHGRDAFRFGYDAAMQWASEGDRPSAVVGNDQWCIGFLSGAFDKGFKCPDDVSVVSSCDTSLCQWFRPSISAFALPLYDNGKAVAELIIDHVEGKSNWIEVNRRAAKVWQQGQLVLRNSSGISRSR